jgi:heme/copper-type cytochrome/quinol oxidase subunit 1
MERLAPSRGSRSAVQEPYGKAMTSMHLSRALLVIAVVAVVAGLMVAAISASQPFSYGWVAQAPLSGDVFDPDRARVVAPTTVLGLVIAVLGLLAGAFWAGLAVGARTHATGGGTPPEA